jgi:hypothetical protein
VIRVAAHSQASVRGVAFVKDGCAAMSVTWEVASPTAETLIALTQIGVQITGKIVFSVPTDDPELIAEVERLFAEKGVVLVRVPSGERSGGTGGGGSPAAFGIACNVSP